MAMGFKEKWLIPGLEQRKYQMSLRHLWVRKLGSSCKRKQHIKRPQNQPEGTANKPNWNHLNGKTNNEYIGLEFTKKINIHESILIKNN
jgi:hypothetical protein